MFLYCDMQCSGMGVGVHTQLMFSVCVCVLFCYPGMRPNWIAIHYPRGLHTQPSTVRLYQNKYLLQNLQQAISLSLLTFLNSGFCSAVTENYLYYHGQ